MVSVSLKSDPQRVTYYVNNLPEVNSDSLYNRLRRLSHIWRPPTDVYETEDAVIVRVEIAAMRETDFSITLDGRQLLVRGTRAEVQERRAYHQMEIPFGDFLSEVELPHEVNPDGIEAVYTNGLLKIVMPKVAPRKIPIDG